MIDIIDSGHALCDDDLKRVEEAVGAPLPSQYRAFLLAHNGGRPTPDTIDIKGAPFVGTDIQLFLGIDDPCETANILWYLDVLEGCKENKLLPIACDSGGNIFTLVLTEENYGHVNYFDSVEVPPKPYLVAHDFDAFLEKIRDCTDGKRAGSGDGKN